MIRSINALDYTVDRHDMRTIRHGAGIRYRKYKSGNGLYGNGIEGEGFFDSIKAGAQKVGNFVSGAKSVASKAKEVGSTILDNVDKVGKVVDVVHKTAKAGIDIAKDVNSLKHQSNLHRIEELRKSQEDSLRSKKESKKESKPSSDDEIFKKLRLQSQAIKKGKGLFLN